MKVINSVLSKLRNLPKDGAKRQLHQFAKILYEQHDVLMVHGKGSTLTDSKGKDYIDMHSMYSAIPVGHANEEFNSVYQDIMDGKLPMTHGAFPKEDMEKAARRIATHTAESIGGRPEDYQVYFNNTGAEAVGTADKFAKQHAYRVRGIADEDKVSVAMTENFHGRMVGTSLFDPKKTLSREGFGPHVPNVEHIKWDDPDDARRFFEKKR